MLHINLQVMVNILVIWPMNDLHLMESITCQNLTSLMTGKKANSDKICFSI